jgi:hypothetical protein
LHIPQHLSKNTSAYQWSLLTTNHEMTENVCHAVVREANRLIAFLHKTKHIDIYSKWDQHLLKMGGT